MRKNTQIGVGALIIALVGTGVGVGISAYFILNQPVTTEKEDVILTISGYGTNRTLKLTMSDLKSNKYMQFENLEYNKSSDTAYNLTGVSIRSIFEVENILKERADNYTFISSDGGFNSVVKYKNYLDINKLMTADYDECIFAYGGEDFDAASDGPIRSVINVSLDEYGGNFGGYWVKDCGQMKVYRPEITIWNTASSANFSITMEQLLSGKYKSFENQLYNRSSDSSYYLTGISIRDILLNESLLGFGEVNYTFIDSEGYDSAESAGYYLNITKLMNANDSESIFAYGGNDFDVVGDGPIRAVLNVTLDEYGFSFGKYWMKHCIIMKLV